MLHWPQDLGLQSKYGDSSHSTNSFSSSTSKPSESLEMPSVAHKKLLAALQGWRTEKPFPARCHNSDPKVSLQIWASESVVCSTSLHGSATWGIPGTQQLPGTKPGSLSLGSGPRYKAHFVQLSYSGIIKRRSERNLNLAWHFHNCRNPPFTALKPYEFKKILLLLRPSE